MARLDYATRYYVAIMWTLALLTLAERYTDPRAVPAVTFLLFVAPIFSWIIIARLRPARWFLWIYRNVHHRIRKDYYFENFPKQAHGVERRTVELFLPILGVSAYAASKLTRVSFESSIALGTFVGFGVAVLAFSGTLLIPIWVFEDSGFRTHSAGGTTVGTPFGVVKGFLVIGSLTSFVYFSWSLAGSLLGAALFTVTLLFVFGPACYWITILFHDRTAKKAVDEIRALGASKGIPLKSMAVT
jgi:hypothetical protein